MGGGGGGDLEQSDKRSGDHPQACMAKSRGIPKTQRRSRETSGGCKAVYLNAAQGTAVAITDARKWGCTILDISETQLCLINVVYGES